MVIETTQELTDGPSRIRLGRETGEKGEVQRNHCFHVSFQAEIPQHTLRWHPKTLLQYAVVCCWSQNRAQGGTWENEQQNLWAL